MKLITFEDLTVLPKVERNVLRELMSYPRGITTRDVSKFGWVRFSGTLDQLRRKGYIIKTTRQAGDEDNFLYRLVGKTEPQASETAYDKLNRTLREHGHINVANELKELLNESGVILRKKQRKFD